MDRFADDPLTDIVRHHPKSTQYQLLSRVSG
jgi:hypothetical protein